MGHHSKNGEKDTYLADWLAGRLSDDELKAKVSASDFSAFQKIKFSLAALEVAPPNMEENYGEIQRKKEMRQKSRSRVVTLYRYTAIAASLLLLVGLYQFFVFSNSSLTGFGETADKFLPDGSRVTLNASSRLTYPGLFRWRREVRLEGEAFFKVTTGSRFSVDTDQGVVSVLGTQFNVIALPDFFEVRCYEGRVSVKTEKDFLILTPGMACRLAQGAFTQWSDAQENAPSWLAGETTFRQLQFREVVRLFERQYQCQIEYPDTLNDETLSGSFTNKNMDVALQSIAVPLQLKFKKTGGNRIKLFQ